MGNAIACFSPAGGGGGGGGVGGEGGYRVPSHKICAP